LTIVFVLVRVALIFGLLVELASAQPQSQPLLQQSDLVYLGSFTTPTNDGAGSTFPQGSLTYGGVTGVGPDGTTLFYGLHSQSNSMAEISIPAIGGVASIVTPGRYMPMNQTFDVPASAAYVGGALFWNNRILVTGYVGYDNNPTAVYSWFTFGQPFTQASRLGPFSMSPTGGLTGQYCGVIPAEWRTLLGGPAACGASSLSIITRSSRGPAFGVFSPDDIGPTTAIAKMLLHYQPPATLQTPPGYVEADSYGGFAFPSGSRSVLYFRRHGDVHCYGTGTECNDPTDSSKGNHAYPYRHEVLAYDANDLVAVKAGTKQPWEVAPYATWTITDMLASGGGVGAATMKSAVYDDVTRRVFITAFSGSSVYGAPRVHVYQVKAPAPPPVPCEGTWAETVTLVPAVCDATQQQIRTVTRTFTQTSGDPTTCPASPVVTISNESCVYVPPPPTGTITIKTVRPQACDIRVTSTPPDQTGGWGVQFTLDGKNMGTRDTSSPYQRDKSNVTTGTIVAGVWSKSDDVRPFTIGPVVCEE
jgi:hypothetical protein